MTFTPIVQQLLSYYESDNPGTKTQLARLLTHGRLGGSGRMIILPVDQGFEHGPARSFASNPPAYDPYYHYQLAIETGLSAYAAPLGMLETGADRFVGQIPTILKMNSACSLSTNRGGADQAVTASVADAQRLGCVAVGFTIYPGSEAMYAQYEELRELIKEAKACGLAVVVWSYPRGGGLSSQGETAIDVVAYGTHMAALLGAHIIKVKMPSEYLEVKASKQVYQSQTIAITTAAERVTHIMQAAFNGRRIVVFSGGVTASDEQLIAQAQAIRAGGGHGSIIGRNSFQRERSQAVALLAKLVEVYR